MDSPHLDSSHARDRHDGLMVLYQRTTIHQGHRQLNGFLTELDGHVSRKKQQEAVITEDLFEAVQTLIQVILNTVARLDPMLKVRRFHPVGSFIEGTKVGTPNEFDFVAEIETFENLKTIQILDECHVVGTVHLLVLNEGMDESSRMHMEKLVYLKDGGSTAGCTRKYLSPVKFRHHFWQIFTAAATFVSIQNYRVKTGSGELNLVSDIPQFLDMFGSGPNIELHMVWVYDGGNKKLGLSADVTPAIRVLDCIPDTIGVDMLMLEKCCTLTGNSYSDVLLIPTFNRECKNMADLTDFDNILCWRLSFSVIETKLLREMPPDHKLCLRILIHLKSLPKGAYEQMQDLGLNLEADTFSSTMIALSHSQGEMNLLTTYMLKMAVLDHNETCATEQETAGRCLIEILHLLQSRVKDNFLPNFFLPSKNTWSRGPVRLLEESMKQTLKFFRDVMEETDYSFAKSYKKFEQLQEFVTERDGC